MEQHAIIDRALGVLRAEGATGDVYIEHRKQLELRVRDGKLENLLRAEVQGLAVRAMKDRRLGFVHTTQLDDDGVATAARRACELSRSGGERDDLTLASPREGVAVDAAHAPLDDEGARLGIFDETLEARPIDEKVTWLVTAESAARGMDDLIKRTEAATYTENISSVWLANTNELARHYKKSVIGVGLEVAAEQGEDKQPGVTNLQAVYWHDLPSAAELGRRTAGKAMRLLGGRPVRTGKFAVVFTPDTGWAPLVYVANALSGEAMDRGRSWLAGKPGFKIGSPLVTIRDGGQVPRAPGSVPFDGEGVDTTDVVLVSRGAVTGQTVDLATSARTGAAPTGNAMRGGYEGLPNIASRNLYLEPGASTPAGILSGVKEGLWVWSLTGWWIGLDPSNPEFSSAAAGVWIEWGKPVKPVARVTIAARLSDLFGNVDAVGSDLVFDDGAKTPTYRVSEMSISGS